MNEALTDAQMKIEQLSQLGVRLQEIELPKTPDVSRRGVGAGIG